MERMGIYGLPLPPTLTLLGKRTKTEEKRIRSLVKRKKSFYLHTTSLDGMEEQKWFVDGGGWAHSSNKLLGHIKNCLEFFNGPHPLWFDDTRVVKRKYTRKTVIRGKGRK